MSAASISRSDFDSPRRILGAPLTLLRRVFLRILRPYLAADARNQMRFNHGVVNALDEAVATANQQRELIAELEERVRTMQGHLDHLDAVTHGIRDNLSPRVWMSEPLTTRDSLGRFTIGFPTDTTTDSVNQRAASPYAAFEQIFRGSGERVREILKPLVEHFAGRTRVLDVGCGGGEFLSLLEEAGISAEGVDIDDGMLTIAHSRGLTVTKADAIEWLRSNPGLYDGLFAGQVVEHLEFDQLTELLDAAVACLRPGSIVVLETPNPYSSGGSQAFRLDPTHTTLLFPEALATLARHAGFESGAIAFPHEWSDLDAALRTEPTYALIGRTPSAKS